jgi:uroporphyrinogen III methyltransferase/synthase
MTTLYTGIITSDNTTAIQQRYGIDVVCTPLIEIKPVANDSRLREAASNLASYNYLLFTSRHAVEHFARFLTLPLPSSIRVVSIGATTTAALQQAGITSVSETDHDNSYCVIEWFSRQPRGRVLIPRSNLALSIIPDGLRTRGFQVSTVTAYRNCMPAAPVVVDMNTIDRIVFTSPSTISHFVSLYGALPPNKIYETRGPITRKYFETQIKIQNV